MSLPNQQPQTLAQNGQTVAPVAPVSPAAGLRAMSPLYRLRVESFTQSLPGRVDECLKTYFKDLNGLAPVTGMYEKVITQVEKPLIEHVLRYVRGNQVRAANILGINRNTLRKKIQTLTIDIGHLMGEHHH
ncbi:MAG TPA: helix-turn-helix domain-containing protein [Alphaproteobacteria bacterium]|nr:helix-turn-helix domain-containing protein [Alphaproteobacteria bacterium]